MKKYLKIIGMCKVIGLAVSAFAIEIEPAPNEVKYPIQSYMTLDDKQLLREWGISLNCEDAGGGDYVVDVRFREPASIEASKGSLEVRFSLWTDSKDFVLSIPDLNLEDGSFMMREGYVLKLLINTQGDALGLRPGVGYIYDVNPKEFSSKK